AFIRSGISCDAAVIVLPSSRRLFRYASTVQYDSFNELGRSTSALACSRTAATQTIDTTGVVVPWPMAPTYRRPGVAVTSSRRKKKASSQLRTGAGKTVEARPYIPRTCSREFLMVAVEATTFAPFPPARFLITESIAISYGAHIDPRGPDMRCSS